MNKKYTDINSNCIDKWVEEGSHTIEEQIGGQLKAGFILTDIYQDTNGTGRLHEYNIPTFYAMRAINRMKKSYKKETKRTKL